MIDVNFTVIFLCLLVGAVVGYEFGKHTVVKRVKEIIADFGNHIKQEAEEMEKRAKAENARRQEVIANWEKIFRMANKPQDTVKMSSGDTDGDKGKE